MDLGLRLVMCEAEAALFGTTADGRVAGSPAPADQPWPTIGRYVVRRRLGVGGMGAVFESYDPVLQRSVALKLLHAELPGCAHERLRREALALARLHHPHVVEVYEIGCAADQTFIAMELVRGHTLEHWLRRSPRRPWRECVQIYLQAGEGLAAAHAAGLVHRDFKPSNCVLGDDGRVRVLDFGLAAELTEATVPRGCATSWGPSAAHTRGLAGTPPYMPLEQLRGERIDATADQYAFCVALYVAVYGLRPFAGESVDALILAQERGELRLPRSGVAPAALLRVLRRGLAREPGERWPGMEALLAELRRVARPARERWGRVGLGLSLALVFAGVAASHADRPPCEVPALVLETWDDLEHRRVERAFLATEQLHARATWERVESRLDAYATRLGEAHVETCEGSMRGEAPAELLDLRTACLRECTVALHETVELLARADRRVVNRAVELLDDLPLLSRCDDAEALRAVVPPPEDPRSVPVAEALRAQLTRVSSLERLGRYDEALRVANAVVTQAEALGYAPLIANAQYHRARVLERLGRYDEASTVLEPAYLLAVEVGDRELAVEVALARALVSGHRRSQLDEGRRWGEAALVLAGALGEPSLEISALNSIAGVLLAAGEPSNAIPHLERAIALEIETFGYERPTAARMLSNLGTALEAAGRPAEAIPLHRRTLAILEATLGPEHPQVTDALTNLGNALLALDQAQEAGVLYRRALVLDEATVGPEHPQAAETRINLALALSTLGEHDEAREHLHRGLADLELALGDDDPRLARALTNLAVVLQRAGRSAEAIAPSRRSLAIFEEALGPRHPMVVIATANLGALEQAYGDPTRAGEALQRALASGSEVFGPESPEVAQVLLDLARLARRQHDLAAARDYAERALAQREARKTSVEDLAIAKLELAKILWTEPASRPRALALARQARDAQATLGPGHAAALEETRAWLAEPETGGMTPGAAMPPVDRR